jgi:diguanylate cyclase (GGDEF)-like protein
VYLKNARHMPIEPHIASSPTPPKRSAVLWYASIFVILVCVVLMAMEAWFAWSNRRSDLDEMQVNLGNLTRALAKHAEDTVKKSDTALFGLVERIEVEGMQPDTLQKLFPLLVGQVAELPELQGIFIYDETGRWQVNSFSDVVSDMDNADRAYFIHHRDNDDRGPYIGAPVRSKSSGDWVIPVSRRINHSDGSFAGVVTATVEMQYFNEYYASFDIGASGILLLTLADATVLVRRPYVESLIGKKLDGGILNTAPLGRRAEAAQTVTSSIDNTERMVSYHGLERYPLVVVAALSKQEVLQSWRTQTLRQAIGVLLLATIIALLGLRLLQQIRTQGRTEHELHLAQQKVLTANKTLQRLALQDSLTGLANRRQFDLTLRSEYDRAAREHRSIAFLMIDVDHFKLFNDIYGHPQGDVCLREVAEAMQARRPGDFSARYGGEEFAVVLAETDLEGALVVAEQIRSAIYDLRIAHRGNPAGVVTVSIGATATVPSGLSGLPAFLQVADKALYRAKGGGRNQVCSSSGDPI